ncbi:hypothetical protein E1B28_002583 [Marasmius oreades]|uniref:Translation initiation factor IF-2, mitochondrial n=1 Tax=Marasmius oreades TaxID=181124 RepID=A0A9P7UKW8_9AGAR|nr:uncharacterized protein E1B28_002583 [Marasmius oreades]KAG7086642.1 hypothetical protein E1B28_002583 [Marasmius oreades]
MHRHGTVVPSVCRRCIQSRTASTAVKSRVDLGKWARPNIEGGTTAGTKWQARNPSAGTRQTVKTTPSLGPTVKSFPSFPSGTFSRRTSHPYPHSGSSSEGAPWSTSLHSPPSRSRNSTEWSDRHKYNRDALPHVDVRPRDQNTHDNSKTRRSTWSTRMGGGDRRDIASDLQGQSAQQKSVPRSYENIPNTTQNPLVVVTEESGFFEGMDSGIGHPSTFQTRRDYPQPHKRSRGRGSIIERLNYLPSSSQPDLNDRQQRYKRTSEKQNVKKPKAFMEKRIIADVYIPSVVSVGTLAQLLNVRLEQLRRRMKRSGMAEEASYDHVLTSDYAVLLAEEFGKNPIVSDEMAFDIYPSPPHPNPSTLPHRPPVVTIMGHVDHGKTTLLDTLRSASVAKGEAGGITQHIGAFSVPVPGNTNITGGPKSITFLDTPGHAAFSAMRARGAGVTDIVVLVVAADDGIMPQTREVIEIIKKERDNLGVIVAINKVDKPGVDIEAVQKRLLSEGIQLEAFGGDVPSVAVSGLTGQGLPEFVETLSAIAEMQDLRAETDGPVHGHILESKMHKGLGAVATVLVSRGSLLVGSHIVSGTSQAKVRVMTDSSGKSVKSAGPGMTVTVSGWKTLPNAGDDVLQGSESTIKKAIANRQRKVDLEGSLVDVEAINNRRREERERRELEADGKVIEGEDERTGPKELRLVVKADVSGSAEAVVGVVQGIGNHLATTKVISSGVGDVTESDVTLAKTAGGIIVAFNVHVPRSMEVLAAQNNVSISSSGIIYRLIEQVTDHVVALLPVVVEKTVTGEATVLQVFEIQVKSKQTTKVAGCRVFNGVVERTKQARVLRDGEIVHEGLVETLRQIKKDVVEVRKGSECGLNLAGFSDLREGDVIQMFTTIEKPGKL